METYTETRKRGIIGWFFLLVFILWNLFMVLWIVSALSNAGGNAAAGGIAFIILLFVWAAGSMVTGILALVTRGSKTIVKKET